MSFSFSFMLVALEAALGRVPITVFLAVAPLLIGCVFGFLIALIRFFKVRIWSQVFRWIVTVIKGVPVILLLLILYVSIAATYDTFMQSIGSSLTFKAFDKNIIAIMALSVYASIGLSEVFRGALSSVKKGQYDAGYAAGLTSFQVLRRIVLPQALPVSLPMVCNILIGLTKAVALISIVGAVDVMNAAVITATGNYRFLEAYVAAAIVYWGICVLIERLFFFWENRLGEKIREVAA